MSLAFWQRSWRGRRCSRVASAFFARIAYGAVHTVFSDNDRELVVDDERLDDGLSFSAPVPACYLVEYHVA